MLEFNIQTHAVVLLTNMSVLTLLLLFTIPACNAIQLWYPPIFWHKDDCRFKNVQRMKDDNATKEVFMKVIYGEGPYGLTIICPTAHMNNWMEDPTDDDSFNENLWQVDKESYDKCAVNVTGKAKENKLLLVCDNKFKKNVMPFIFQKTYGLEDILDVIFEPGKHYYFISTSNGDSTVLKTRKVSGKDGSCVKHHMKLHIYVCQMDKEDCIYEPPRCDPPPALYREMRLIGGKLPAPSKRPALRITPQIRIPRKTEARTYKQVMKPTTPGGDGDEEKMPICKKEEKGTSIHLILNFVLGGVALFMAVVIIVLVCGLSGKDKSFEMERPPSAISTTHGGQFVNAEIVRYSDGHVQLSPVVLSRTPPTSPNMIIPPYPTLQRVHSQPQYTPSDNVPLEDTPPGHSPLETPLSNEAGAFPFPDEPRSEYPESSSDVGDSSDSGPTTTAVVTNPQHDQELDT